MFMKRSSSEAQFKYWNLRRNGLNQSDIARKFDITRQSVSKSIKVQERDVIIKLLEYAQVSGILPIYYDQVIGILIGSIPPLGNLRCILIIDENNVSRIFYEPKANPDKSLKNESQKELRDILNNIIVTDRFSGLDFHHIIDKIMNKRRGD